MTHPPDPPAEDAATTSDIARRDSHQLRHGRLGVFAVAFFVISAAAPLTAMAGDAPSLCSWATVLEFRRRRLW
jgi:hypothetical protein